jgi:hypothetical protein
MDKSTVSNWRSGLVINLASNLIGLIVGVIVTYLKHEGSGWVVPVLCGGAAWLITFCLILAWRNMRNLPPKMELTTSDNVERKIREWLDKFSLTVQAVRDEGCHFFFIVTTDGGKKISISRSSKHFNDYLLVKALWTASDEEKKLIDVLTGDEKIALRLAIQLELARSVIGYSSENIYEITMFKRVPISSSLGEAEILNAVWEIEAMLSSVFIVGGMALHRHNLRTAKEGTHEI